MKALVGAFNQEKALVGAFSVIVQPVVEPMELYTALGAARHRAHHLPAVQPHLAVRVHGGAGPGRHRGPRHLRQRLTLPRRGDERSHDSFVAVQQQVGNITYEHDNKQVDLTLG